METVTITIEYGGETLERVILVDDAQLPDKYSSEGTQEMLDYLVEFIKDKQGLADNIN